MTRNRKQRQRIALSVLAGLLLCAGIGCFFLEQPAVGTLLLLVQQLLVLDRFRRLQRRSERKEQTQERAVPPLADETGEKRAQALIAQINPHFLYNSLESIRGKAYCDGNVEIAEMTEALSSFFRYSISTRNNIVTLKDELRNVQKYFQIQMFRFGDRFVLKQYIDANEAVLSCSIPNLTLQPIVENCFNHGLEDRCEKGIITIRVIETNREVIIDIADNGVGIEPRKLEVLNEKLNRPTVYTPGNENRRQAGIALPNIQERIRMAFGEAYGLKLYSTVNVGTEVEIRLPRIPIQDYEQRRTRVTE